MKNGLGQRQKGSTKKRVVVKAEKAGIVWFQKVVKVKGYWRELETPCQPCERLKPRSLPGEILEMGAAQLLVLTQFCVQKEVTIPHGESVTWKE